MRLALAAVGLASALAWPAIAPAQDWSATSGEAFPAPEGWRCQQMVELPLPAATQAGVCRRADVSSNGRLRLLLFERLGGGPPSVRELGRLGDANAAALRLFTPPQACSGDAACVRGLLLVDQRDESSCYGTQVWLLTGNRALRDLGFIDEVREADGALSCMGGFARVKSDRGTALITLPGPLSRVARDGTSRRVAASEVTYRVTGAVPKLQRQPLHRAAQ